MIDYLLEYDLSLHLVALGVGTARLFAFVSMAPFMGNAALNVQARGAIVLSMYLPLHPVLLDAISPDWLLGTGLITLIGLILKEIFLGLTLGWLAGMVFWAIESAGSLIDNQRGASMAQGSDPTTGEQISPTASFLFQSTCYAFFASGSFFLLIATLYGAYEIWPVTDTLPSAFFLKDGAALFFGEKVAELALNAVLLSAPVVLACLFTDISLGLVNRFASQLNVYILAMPIKSGLASFLLIIYFAMLMTDAPERFAVFGIDVSALRVWWQ